jgi:putative membrane protein
MVAVVSALLAFANAWLELDIPFSDNFLAGYVIALMAYVVSHSVLSWGLKRSLWMFAFAFIIAFSAEVLSINYGLGYGNYYYTDLLGKGLFGMPFLTALTWVPVLYSAFSLSEYILIPVRNNFSARIRFPVLIGVAVTGALATTAWDLMIDPIAVSQGWWVWVDGGQYVPYLNSGIPVSNYIGWLIVSFVIMLIFVSITRGAPPIHHSPSLRIYGPITLYASLLITTIGATLSVLDRPEVALVGLLAMGPFLAIAITKAFMTTPDRTAPNTCKPD